MPSGRFSRIVQVTTGLSILGALVGGTLGPLLLALVLVRLSHSGDGLGEPLLYAAAFGAATGAVLAPVAGWTLMRHVPIWRAIAETALGTVVGAGIGLIFQPMHDVAWLSPAYLGLAGFALAAVRLRLARRRVSQGTEAGGA